MLAVAATVLAGLVARCSAGSFSRATSVLREPLRSSPGQPPHEALQVAPQVIGIAGLKHPVDRRLWAPA